MKLLFATGNAGKLRELGELVAPLGIQVVSPRDLASPLPEVDEDALTFAGNAEKKARSALAATGLAALADDSGLEVDALAGAPGVRSARYAGAGGIEGRFAPSPGLRAGAQDRANNAKLLGALAGVPDEQRTARFRCALALVFSDGALLTAEGACEGAIAHAPRGAGGFGYDPLFLVGGGPRTMAELSSDEKNRISHRGQALRALAARLAQR